MTTVCPLGHAKEVSTVGSRRATWGDRKYGRGRRSVFFTMDATPTEDARRQWAPRPTCSRRGGVQRGGAYRVRA